MADGIITAIEAAAEPPDPLRLACMPTNDLGLAERMRARFGDQLARTPEAGWVAWSGEVWATNHKGEALAKIFAHRTAQALWEEYNAAAEAEKKAEAEGDEASATKWKHRARAILEVVDKAGDSGKTTAILAQAAPYLAAEIADFDPDIWRICVANGTLIPSFITEPCLVARDAKGVTAGWAKASAIAEVGARVRVGSWRVENIGEGVFAVASPDSVENDTEAVELPDLKRGLARGGATLRHVLYHLHIDLAPHTPEHRITRMAGAAYDPAAKAPRWLKHIETVIADPTDRAFFQRAMGYGLCGSQASQCFLFVQGKGADGKSTTMRVIDRVLGEYGRMCDPRSWLETKQRSAADASPDMADMAGDTRLLYCEEPPKGARVNEALLKAASGGATMKARQLHQGLFEFEPRFLLTMAFNDLPRVSGGDDGFWRRMRLIRFRRQFTPAEQLAAGDMVEQLCEEAPGILNWLLDGLAAWRKLGLAPHAAMAEDILEYRSQSNPFGEWWRDRVELHPGARTKNSDLYKDYKEYLEGQGVDGRELLGTKAFANQLSSLQISMVKVRGERFRVGVRLRPQDEFGLSVEEEEGEA